MTDRIQKKENKKQRGNGFTLVEMLVYFGVLSVFLFVLTSMFTNILDMQLDSQADSDVDSDARFIYARLAYDISRSDSIVTPATIGSSSSALTLSIQGTPVTYSVQNGVLQAQTATQTTALNGFDTSTQSVSFTHVGNSGGKNGVQFDITIASNTRKQSGYTTKEIQSTVGER